MQNLISGVSERDIDLLLLEEFISSTEFQNLFLSITKFKDMNLEFIEAKRSVTDTTGESDVEVTFKSDDNYFYKILIENKVNAGLQSEQQKRYVERGNGYISNKNISDYITFLVAPKKYHNGEKIGFDYRVNYEDILNYFQDNKALGNRKIYKELLLSSAIEKGTLGYQMIADSSVTDFWKAYWLLGIKIASEFNMDEPSHKPSSSSFIYFRNNQVLPTGVDLVHKLTHGYFDLQFSGMGDKQNILREKYFSKMKTDMNIVPAGKSASIRIEVPELSLSDSFESQKDKVIEAINKGRNLLGWYDVNFN